MFSLSMQTLRARKAGFVATFLAVFGGTALVAACGILLQSGISGGISPQRLAAAPIVVGAAQSVTVTHGADRDTSSEPVGERVLLPADLVDRVAAVPGVRKAVGELGFPATVITGSGQVLTGPDRGPSLGHGWDSAALAPFTLRSGRAPDVGEVVLDAELAGRAGVAVGQQVRIAVHSEPVSYRVSGIAAPERGDGLLRESALFFADQQARQLSGSAGRVTAVGVFADPGTEVADLAGRISQAVGPGAVVHTGLDRGEVEFLSNGDGRTVLIAVSGSFGGMVVMIVVFVVGSMLALVVFQRRREFALLRAVAATPRQVHRLIATETFLMSGVAALLGVLPGLWLAGLLRDTFSWIGIIPAGFELSVGPIPLGVGIVTCVLAARLAAWMAARQAVRIRPVEALGESTVERRELGLGRTVTGWMFVAAAFAALGLPLLLPAEIGAGLAGISAMLAVVGISLLGPPLVAAATGLTGRLLSRSRAAGYLAGANTSANSRRLAAAVTPLVLAIGVSVTQFFSATTLTAAAQHQAGAATTADYVVSSSGAGVPVEVAAAIRAVRGVGAATPLVSTEVVSVDSQAFEEPLSKTRASAVDGSQLSGTLDLGLTAGRLDRLDAGSVALSQREADWLGKQVGDQVDLYLGDATRITQRLVAVYRTNLGYGDVLLPAEVVVPHTSDRLADSVLVGLASGADPAAVERALAPLLERYPGLVLADRQAMVMAVDDQQAASRWLNWVLTAVIMIYIALSVANTLIAATTDRAREFALLRLVGGTRRQVVAMMRAESLIVVGIAVVVGSLVPVLPLAALGIGLTGQPLPAGSPWVYLGIVGFTALLGILSIRLPTRRVLRASPVEAIGVRD